MKNTKQLAFFAVIVSVLFVGFFGVTKANYSFMDNVADKIAEKFVLMLASDIDVTEDGMVGASGDTNLTNLVLEGDLTVDDDATITGELIQGSVSTDWYSGTCADATTTIFGFVNPWGVDVYIDQFILTVTGVATTTWTADVGTSTSAYGDVAAPSEALVDDTGFATSTAGRIANDNGTVSAVYGFTDPGTNSQPIILLDAAEYLSGVVTTAYAGAFTEASNTFACTYKVHAILE